MSRPVLREAGGEIPLVYSPCAVGALQSGKGGCGVEKYIADGGRSSGVALQWEISNHLMRLGSKALVVSNEEKSWNTWQVGMEKVNEIKPLMNASRV